MTKQEKICQILAAKGLTEVRGKSAKYRTFARKDRVGEFYFVGKNGALRTGRNVSDSISLTGVIK